MKRIAVVHAPSIAGGPLLLLNRLLQALGEARARAEEGGEEWGALLCLDEQSVQARDRDLLLLNAFGDPVVLHGPEGGVLTEEDRAALAAAAGDTLPPTAQQEAVIERLLPAPGRRPAEAAAGLWRGLLGPAGLEVQELRACGPVAAAVGSAPWPQCELIPAREVTWFGPRHLALLAELGAPPAAALAGEGALRKRLSARESTGTLALTGELRKEWEAGLARLEKTAEAEDPRLLGAWMRLRRELRQALRDFGRRAERNARNRRGIRGARLHALAQGLRPLDGPQQERLGILAAAALFRLDLDRLEEHVAGFARPPRAGPLLLATSPGARLEEDRAPPPASAD